MLSRLYVNMDMAMGLLLLLLLLLLMLCLAPVLAASNVAFNEISLPAFVFIVMVIVFRCVVLLFLLLWLYKGFGSPLGFQAVANV